MNSVYPLINAKPKPIVGFFIVSLLIVFLLAPLLFVTPWFEQIDAAAARTGIPLATDYITAFRLMSAAPESIPGVTVAILQPFAPDIAAFTIALTLFGGAGVWALIRKYRFWAPAIGARRGLTLWLLCITLMVAISLTTAGINHLLLPAHELSWSVAPLSGAFWGGLLVAMFLDGGAVAEETGWRGFVLPLLQGQMAPLKATLVLSLLWAAWHMPVKLDILFEEGAGNFALYFLLFSVRMALVSIIMTYFFNKLGGSTFIAIAIHGLHNDSLRLMGRVENEPAYFVQMEFAMIAPLAVAAVTLVVLTRGRLGFDPSLHAEITYPPKPAAPH
jgi:uncharacterized protein